MRSSRFAWLAALIIGAGRGSSAGQADVDFSSDQFLIGKWACEMSTVGGESGHEAATYSLDLGGRWLRVDYTLTPGDSDRLRTSTSAFETYDSSLKKWVYVSVSSDGSYGMSYSDGWLGDVKVYRPPSSDPQSFKLTATRVSDVEFTEVVEILSNGQWSITSKLNCKRAEGSP